MSGRIKKESPIFPQEITSNEEISPGVYLISFRRNFNFLPGQVVKIGINNDHPPRIYSICSGGQEEEVRILFNIKDDGFLTPKMAALIPGDVLYVSAPYGSFLGSNDPAWWIATGTGIAPFYAMFRSGMSENKKLIHGVRKLNQFYFEDELDWAMGDKYVRCCSQEESCDVFPGRVTGYLTELEEFPDIYYYLCGKALMVVEVRDLLIERGVNYEKIIAEIYF
ncbi:MAG TPA: FAD-dependent oxidoreductase [Draconibacterium sp.]|nr:FAD-dependent oxidoreductase [Draconibacterium sp.]